MAPHLLVAPAPTAPALSKNSANACWISAMNLSMQCLTWLAIPFATHLKVPKHLAAANIKAMRAAMLTTATLRFPSSLRNKMRYTRSNKPSAASNPALTASAKCPRIRFLKPASKPSHLPVSLLNVRDNGRKNMAIDASVHPMKLASAVEITSKMKILSRFLLTRTKIKAISALQVTCHATRDYHPRMHRSES